MADRRQVRADLVRAAGLERHPRRVGADRRSTSKWASRLAWRVGRDRTRASGRPRSRPIGASIVPVARPGPSTSARYSRRLARVRISSCRLRSAASDLATSISPLVSRSSRCTIPGATDRARPRRGRRAPGRASRSGARARVDDDAGRLVDHDQRVVLEDHLVQDPLAGRAPGPARRAARSATTRRRRRSRCRFCRVRPSTVTAPASISRWAAARSRRRGDGRGTRRAAHRRPPGARSGPPPLGAVIGPHVDHVEQPEHTDDDPDVGHVERRPGDRVDEVDHRALASAVGEVAERPAEDQADRQPQEADVAVDARSRRPGRRGRSDDRGDERAAAGEGAERHALVAHVGQVDPEEDVDLLAALERLTAIAFVTWSATTVGP